MPKKKCAICGKKDSVKKLYYCPNCKMWICWECTSHGVFQKTKCPRCNKALSSAKK